MATMTAMKAPVKEKKTATNTPIVESKKISKAPLRPNKAVMIPVDHLHTHPKNVRRQLKGLQELADNLMNMGFLQNGIVVPWDCVNPGEVKKDHYFIVAGNRRHAAAKIGGITVMPCTIERLTLQEQVEIMYIENIQRDELTLEEQAEALQTMIDLGGTVESISKKTGYSKAKINKRLDLLKLDREALRQSLSRGASLDDYAKLMSLKDEKKRTKVLESIGTSNFQWQLQEEASKEKWAAKKKNAIAALKKFAERVKSKDGYVTENIYNQYSDKVVKPGDTKKVKYFFHVAAGAVTLLRKETPAEKAKATKKANVTKKEVENRAALMEKVEQAYMMRKLFLTSFTAFKTHRDLIYDFVALSFFNRNMAGRNLPELLKVKLSENEVLTNEKISELTEKDPERTMMMLAYHNLGDNEKNGYIETGYFNQTSCAYAPNKVLDVLYGCLVKLGYQMSEEETALHNGTHKLYSNRAKYLNTTATETTVQQPAMSATAKTEKATTEPKNVTTEKPAAASKSTIATEKSTTAPKAIATAEKPVTAPKAPSIAGKPTTASKATVATEKSATAPKATATAEKSAITPKATATAGKLTTAPKATATTEKPAIAPKATATAEKPATAPKTTATAGKPATAPKATVTAEKPVPVPKADKQGKADTEKVSKQDSMKRAA